MADRAADAIDSTLDAASGVRGGLLIANAVCLVLFGWYKQCLSGALTH
jgi:hypothetical protein